MDPGAGLFDCANVVKRAGFDPASVRERRESAAAVLREGNVGAPMLSGTTKRIHVSDDAPGQ